MTAAPALLDPASGENDVSDAPSIMSKPEASLLALRKLQKSIVGLKGRLVKQVSTLECDLAAALAQLDEDNANITRLRDEERSKKNTL